MQKNEKKTRKTKMKPSKERGRRFLGHGDEKAESRETPSADVVTAFRYIDFSVYVTSLRLLFETAVDESSLHQESIFLILSRRKHIAHVLQVAAYGCVNQRMAVVLCGL